MNETLIGQSKRMRSTLLSLAALLLLAALLAATRASAEEVITLESTIVGSQEQPRVLYIIPWKQASSLEKLDGGLPQTIGDIFEHQEYSEFKREIEMIEEGD